MLKTIVLRASLQLQRFRMAEQMCTKAAVASDEITDNATNGEKSSTLKRDAAPENDENSAKKQKVDDTDSSRDAGVFRKKKMALMMVYSGKGYLGMQRNPGCRTIEGDLVQALFKAGAIREDQVETPSKMKFQRAARTDKGVSAAGQLVSILMRSDLENAVEKINSHLPPQIKVLSIKRVTKGFDSKNQCTGRSYLYLLPTFAFTPFDLNMKLDTRLAKETHERINHVMAKFKGTHNFHNFTSGKKPDDPSAKRYITHFSMGEPFVRDGVEFAVISINGQSFMMHQIRKMIGLTIAIIQGLADEGSFQRAQQPEKCDIPKAPGLGLMLDKCHYIGYNKRYAGTHDQLNWDDLKDEIEKFKKEQIFSTMVNTEISEKSMFSWLSTLHLHTFDDTRNEEDCGERLALYNLQKHREKEANASNIEETDAEGKSASDPEKKEIVESQKDCQNSQEKSEDGHGENSEQSENT